MGIWASANIIAINITAITIINITKTMIFNIIRKSDRAAQLPRLLGGRTTQVFAMHCIRIFSNPKWINSIFQFLKRTHLYVNCFFFFSSLEVTLGVDFGIFTLCLVYKRALKKCSIIVLVHTRLMSKVQSQKKAEMLIQNQNCKFTHELSSRGR